MPGPRFAVFEHMKKYHPIKESSDIQHIAMVKDIFSTIPGRYDFLTHLLSLWRDVAWRRFAVRKMHFFHTNRFLDVATGTADLAIDAAMYYPHIQVAGLDFVREMIDLGRKKIERKNLSKRIKILKGDMLHIPSPPDSFDVAGIAFGIRNTPDKIHSLREMTRVVVPGGQVLILEMAFPRLPYFRGIYHLYLKKILPLTARAFSLNPDAYCYLADSIINCPTPENLKGMMEQAGLIDVEIYSLTLGITYLHIGYKPDHSCPK